MYDLCNFYHLLDKVLKNIKKEKLFYFDFICYNVMGEGVSMDIEFGKEIIDVLNLIKDNGYEAYVVGGCVRDYLLNKENCDIDITTNAVPCELKEIFKNFDLEENFMDLGSIKFQFNKYHIEITTFRKEYDYINHRKPSKVEFVKSLNVDLKRRDFTINALCSDGENLIDLHNGIRDLNNKLIKTIGDPSVRFEEDALRILRAFRFASKLGFSVDKEEEIAIDENYKYLKDVSFDIKYRELKGILEGDFYVCVLKKYKRHLMDIFNLEKLNIELFNNSMNYEEREALFFYFSKNNIDNKYLINRDVLFSGDKKELKRILMTHGKENIYNVLFFKSKILKINKDDFFLLEKIIENNECYNLKMLDINGYDLLKINIENNKIGKYLNILLMAVIEENCLNEKKELLKYLKKNILD